MIRTGWDVTVPSEHTGLVAKHVLEFPGGYTRSTGPVIGRFLTELRDGRIVGVRTPDGKVIVPPLEYDPATGAPVTGDGFVPVGPGGTVTAWAWVSEPRRGHPLRQPFCWALIRLDGADTALLHAVDTGGASERMRPALRVWPRWREAGARTGRITDIECFVPEKVQAPDRAAGPAVTMFNAPSRVEYRMRAGRALSRFLEGLGQGRILGHRCDVCGKVYVPMRGLCPADGVATTQEAEVADTGTITTFAVNNIPDPRAPEVPFVSAHVLLDGADVPILALVGGVPAAQVRMGMRVRAAWLPREQWQRSMSNIKWFAPAAEPDAAFESYRNHV